MVYDWNILNEDYKNNLIDKVLEYNSSFSKGGKNYKIVNKDDLKLNATIKTNM